MNIHIRKSSPPPPPPHFLIKNVLLCFLLIAFLTVPIASQAQTPEPTAPPRLTNPTVMAPCGLPASYAEFTSAATVTTFNMTADCMLDSQSIQTGWAFLHFSSGTFTINGNGYSIIGPSNRTAMYLGGSTVVLNLNNVVIRQFGVTNGAPVAVRSGSRLDGRNIVFRDNVSERILHVADTSQVALENVWFLNNRSTANNERRGSGLSIEGGFFGSPTVRITNTIFQGNAGSPNVVVKNTVTGILEFKGCLTFSGNLQADGVMAANNYNNAANITDNNTGACPAAGFSYWLALTPAPTTESQKRAKKTEDSTPTPTPRPAYGASYTALQTATGMTFEAAYGLDSGVHFRQLDGAGIGIQSIIDAGYLAALDVYGYVEQGVEVCFPQIGRVIFLDAQTMPRAIVPLDATVRNGMTCASIDSPGSLVLLPN